MDLGVDDLMKKTIIMIMSIILLLCFTSCDRYPVVDYGASDEEISLFSIVPVTVPGGDCAGYATIVDEDSYGRLLLCAQYANDVTFCFGSQTFMGYFICQTITNDWVYYYEDICYILYSTSDFSNASQEEVETHLNELKTANDWNQPLNNEKMIKTTCIKDRYKSNVTILTKKQEKGIKKAFLELSGESWGNVWNNSTSDEYRITPSATDANGKHLAYLVKSGEYSEDEHRYLNPKCYAVIVSADGSYTDHAIKEITNPYQCQNDIQTLKELNNWIPVT
ncbi:MAG: hypothetical protein E7581_04465 [Ruminococcaceae bacterium]|nr:hypothetical protein [Oscillospiraceae bacterium]